MDCDNYEVIYCADDDEYIVYCIICDKLCIERYYKNHLKSQTHTNHIYEKKSFQVKSLNKIWNFFVFVNYALINVNSKCYKCL